MLGLVWSMRCLTQPRLRDPGARCSRVQNLAITLMGYLTSLSILGLNLASISLNTLVEESVVSMSTPAPYCGTWWSSGFLHFSHNNHYFVIIVLNQICYNMMVLTVFLSQKAPFMKLIHFRSALFDRLPII